MYLNKILQSIKNTFDAVRTRIAERLGVWPCDNYGLGGFYGSGVAGESEVSGGLHVLSDTYIVEVLDPESDEVISHRIRVEYNHSPIVTVLNRGTLSRSSGKAKRIFSLDEYWKLLGKENNK